jgi:hypothetical protein
VKSDKDVIKVLWFSRHTCKRNQLTAMEEFLGGECEIYYRKTDDSSVSSIIKEMKRLNCTEVMFVGTELVKAALIKKGIHPLRSFLKPRDTTAGTSEFWKFGRICKMDLEVSFTPEKAKKKREKK